MPVESDKVLLWQLMQFDFNIGEMWVLKFKLLVSQLLTGVGSVFLVQLFKLEIITASNDANKTQDFMLQKSPMNVLF
jgi:hypothetical protein